MSHILWNPNVRYLIHNSPPPVLILSKINPVQALQSSFRKIHFNIILSQTPESPKWSLSLRLYHHNSACASSLKHMCCISNPSLLDLRSTDHKAPLNVVFFSALLSGSSYALVSPSAPFSRTPPVYVSPPM
jgi:hypothetical protein